MEAIRQSEDGRRFNVRLLCIRASLVPMDKTETIPNQLKHHVENEAIRQEEILGNLDDA